jgi:hypothetical protein
MEDNEIDPDEFNDASPNPVNDCDLATACDVLQERAINLVEISYSGCGDDGGVDDVEFVPSDIQVPDWVTVKLRDLANGYCPEGYWNNEGGGGTLTIHPALGLAELQHRDYYEDTEAMEADESPLPRRLQNCLAKLGIVSISAHFDGCGDSGQFDEFAVDPDVPLGDALQEEVESLLFARLHDGWELDTGSFGDCSVDVTSGTVTIDASWRVEKESETQTTRWKWRK